MRCAKAFISLLLVVALGMPALANPAEPSDGSWAFAIGGDNVTFQLLAFGLWQIQISHVDEQVLAYTNMSNRTAEATSPSQFVEAWNELFGPDDKHQPNIAVFATPLKGGAPQKFPFSMKQPTYDEEQNTLTFLANVLNAEIQPTLNDYGRAEMVVN